MKFSRQATLRSQATVTGVGVHSGLPVSLILGPAPFVAAIDQAGILAQAGSRRFIQVLKPVQVAMGDSFGELRPNASGFRTEVEIDFANPVIVRQSYTLELSPERFRREISRART